MEAQWRAAEATILRLQGEYQTALVSLEESRREAAQQKADIQREVSRLAAKEREEVKRRQHEDLERERAQFEFVVQSRSELIALIWDVYNQVTNLKKNHKVMTTSAAWRTMPNGTIKTDAKVLAENIEEALRLGRRIVCNFFSEVEKLHLGCSLYHFPPDDDCYRKVAGEADMKRLVANELLRAGAFVEVRSDKMGSARRSRSTTSSVASE